MQAAASFAAAVLCVALLPASVEGFSVGSTALTMAQGGAPLNCIVTGGSSGIGEAVCRALGNNGARVFVTGRQAENLERVAGAVGEAGGCGAFGTGDVAVEADVTRLFSEAQSFFAAQGEGASVDVLVTSAGIGRFGKIEELSVSDFESSFDTNVKGTWLWARAVLPHMKETGKGQMVFVSSVAGLRKFARCSVYGASKWAVQGIAGSLREECRGTGVKIASLCPGSVATPWWLERDRGGKDIPATPEQLEKMLTVDDVAAACMSIITQSKSADTESIVLEPPPASMS